MYQRLVVAFFSTFVPDETVQKMVTTVFSVVMFGACLRCEPFRSQSTNRAQQFFALCLVVLSVISFGDDSAYPAIKWVAFAMCTVVPLVVVLPLM